MTTSAHYQPEVIRQLTLTALTNAKLEYDREVYEIEQRYAEYTWLQWLLAEKLSNRLAAVKTKFEYKCWQLRRWKQMASHIYDDRAAQIGRAVYVVMSEDDMNTLLKWAK